MVSLVESIFSGLNHFLAFGGDFDKIYYGGTIFDMHMCKFATRGLVVGVARIAVSALASWQQEAPKI